MDSEAAAGSVVSVWGVFIVWGVDVLASGEEVILRGWMAQEPCHTLLSLYFLSLKLREEAEKRLSGCWIYRRRKGRH